MLSTYKGVAHPWLCDLMGHLNTRHYVAMFDDATHHLLAATGYSHRWPSELGRGFAEVRMEIDFVREVPAGMLLEVRSGVIDLGTTSISVLSEMRCVEVNDLRARARCKIVHFDLRARRAIPLTEEQRRLAEGLRLESQGP